MDRRNESDQADDDRVVRERRSITRKLVTPGNTVATVASTLAAYFIYRAEFQAAQPSPVPENVAALTATVTELNATVARLNVTVQRLESKLEALTDAKTSFEATLNSFRLNIQNTEYRLGRVESELSRIPVRKQ